MISRRNLTDLILETVSGQTSLPVGDAHPPDAPYGWSGTPGEIGSTFTPYTIVTPQSGSISTGSLADTQADWRLPYSLSSFGTSREQCEWVCDLARSAFIVLKEEEFDGVDGTYYIQTVRLETIGGIVKTESLEPPTFGQTDMITVWVTKEL